MATIDEGQMKEAYEVLKCFNLPLEDYVKVYESMYQDMCNGLKKSGNVSASIKMYPTYVTNIPDGSEIGRYIALDLGGTNYRVLLVELVGRQSPPKIEERFYAIPKSILSGQGEGLFDYMAETLVDFLKSHDLSDEELMLAFTFSFPCLHNNIASATLVQWSKGFCTKGVVGNDVTEMLQRAIDKKGCKVKCVALVNDSVGTLAACALEDRNCAIGLILGKGNNAAYIEKRENVELMDGHQSPFVIINTEWPTFGEHGELDKLRNKFDEAVDKDSVDPGKRLFEKMVSGMYLCEVVRYTLIDLVKQGILFHGQMPDRLLKKDAFFMKYIADVEHDPDHLHHGTMYVLTEEIGVNAVEPSDCKIVQNACELIITRAAYLVAAGLVSLLLKMNRPEVTVGVDGSMYKFHPRFRAKVQEAVDRLKPKEISCRLNLSEDGSGKGAAAIAAAANRAN